MDRPLIVGDLARLQFELHWESNVARGTAADATRGRLLARLAGRTVWGATVDEPGGFSWTWVELVEYLARHWAYLLIEEGDPLALDVAPEHLRARAEERWARTTAEIRAAEEEALFAYLESHDLGAAVQGAYPASLWLSRDGEALRASCKQVVTFVPLGEARETLTQLGEGILARLVEVQTEPRAAAAIAAWQQRETVDALRLAEIATGLDRDAVATLATGSPRQLTELRFDAAFEPDEFLAVARMASGALPAEELVGLLRTVRGVPAVWTGPVDKVADEVAAVLGQTQNEPPFKQGHAAARWFRQHLALADAQRVEPEQVLSGWKVPIIDLRLSSRELDAVSIWSAQRGPAVLVNRNGRHGRMNGRRATLAHEIGHLLMDRHAGLPVAEVLGGRVSARIEMRARAFAAELLLPEEVAGREILEARDEKEALGVVRRLSTLYGASREIVAWQAANAHERRLPAVVRAALRSLVSRPETL